MSAQLLWRREDLFLAVEATRIGKIGIKIPQKTLGKALAADELLNGAILLLGIERLRSKTWRTTTTR
jgi:hypothetical protein